MEISNEIYKYFADIIYKNTGIVYLERDYFRLESRVVNLCKEFGVEDAKSLYTMFIQNTTADMLSKLLDIGTNNESYFFRDDKQFKAFFNEIAPIYLDKSHGNLSIWCAASSFGQEPYSIYMGLNDKFSSKMSSISIEATDISNHALERAKKGNYDGIEIQRGLPITTLMKYFSQEENETWTICKEARDKIHYSKFNLLSGIYPSQKYDVIFCRNVLIYQNEENRKDILKRLVTSLRPNGFLLLGSGESLIGMGVNLKSTNFNGSYVYKNEVKEAA